MKALIIEDDAEIVEAITLAFRIRWPEAALVSAGLGETGLEMVETEKPDVVILDLGLPDINGFEVLKQIRLFSDVPILILTARFEEADIIKGLEWGADEYITKPFRQLELLARVRALLRRGSSLGDQTILTCGQLRFNPTALQAFNGGREINVTRTEGLILECLMRNGGHPVAHSSLAEAVWGTDFLDAGQSLKVYVRRLREKIEADPSQPEIILTRPGAGYLIPK